MDRSAMIFGHARFIPDLRSIAGSWENMKVALDFEKSGEPFHQH
jgi:hypothetical protein